MKGIVAALAVGLAIVALIVAWPARVDGPEPIAYGRDVCAHCRMHISQPGYAAELRLADTRLSKFDDIGCMLRAVEGNARGWVEDHEGGGLVDLAAVTFVRAPELATPMGSGLVAFADEAAAATFAREHRGAAYTLAQLVHEIESTRGPAPHLSLGGGTPAAK